MNLKRARYIIAIYESGGYTAAAKKMFISQPYISQIVQQVEQEMRVPIFERGVTPPKLTYAGEKYVEAARAMIAQEDSLNLLMEELRHEERGIIRIGISLQRVMQLMPTVLPKFTLAYPHIQLVLTERGSQFLEQMVEDASVDIAFVTTEPSIANLEYQLLQNETYGILTGRESRLLDMHLPGDWIDLQETADEAYIFLKKGHNIRVIQDKIFTENNLSPRVLAETDSLEAAIRISAACSCCMLCPHEFVRSDPAIAGSGVYFNINDIKEKRHFYVCYRKDRHLPSSAHTFIELIKDAVKMNGSGPLQGASGS